MKSFVPNHWKGKLVVLTTYIGLLSFWWYMDFGCVIKNVIKIPCPGCGLTRAWISAINAKFTTAFQYHSMFWSVPILVFYLIYDIEPFKNRKLNYAILFLILLGWLFNYFMSIILF